MTIQIANSLIEKAEEHLGVKEIEDYAKKCESELEGLLINIQTLGQLICAANMSKEMSDFDNQMSGLIVKEMGNEAQELHNLKSNFEYYAKLRKEGKVPFGRQVKKVAG